MNSGELHAFDYASGKPVRLAWQSGRITSLIQVSEQPADDLWIAPPLVDLQINGYAGVDFQQDGVTSDELLLAARALRRDGCTRFLFTLITDEWPRMLARVRNVQELRRKHEELERAILGFHIEGPFLSPKPGFCGAHNPAFMQQPTTDAVRELASIVATTPLLLTIAPELPGAIELIRAASAAGFRVSLGHTDASSPKLTEAIAAGATAFTHLGNGCPQVLDRHDNILWRVLDSNPTLSVSLIPDGQHVSPSLFRVIHRVRDDNIYYTTDAMSAAGSGPGQYRLGQLNLVVQEDGVVRVPGKTNFAGSSLTPIRGIFKAAEMTQRPWQKVWEFFSARPLTTMGIAHSPTVGSPAEFCLLRFVAGQEHSLANLELTTVVP